MNLEKDKEWIQYATEADILNGAVFGCLAKEWRLSNPKLALDGKNIRDMASINELVVLSNAENLNSQFMADGMDRKKRFLKLREVAQRQLKALYDEDFIKSLKHVSDMTYPLAELQQHTSTFDKQLMGLLSTPLPKKINK